MPGRTTWWAKDAAWHRRELIVELGEEHGAGGSNVMDVLCCWAQEQRALGVVRGGFRSLAREAFISVDDAHVIVEHAAQIGALDDLTLDGDGRRFTCRVSGWEADQERGRAAFRKAAQRQDTSPEPVPDRDLSHSNGTCPGSGRDVTASPLPNQTIKERTTSSPSEAGKQDNPETADPDVLRLSHLLADLIVQRDPKASPQPDSARWLQATRLLLSDRNGDVAEVERVLRWSQADAFWQTNILSPTKLRAQFTQLAMKSRSGGTRTAVDPAAQERRARRGDALRSLMHPVHEGGAA